jgi:hypothetical protein
MTTPATPSKEKERRFAKEQPKDGDTILHCGHLERKPHHAFKMPSSQFTRLDGTRGESEWMLLCQDCFNAHADEPQVCIRADSIWKGDAPEFRENFQ